MSDGVANKELFFELFFVFHNEFINTEAIVQLTQKNNEQIY